MNVKQLKVVLEHLPDDMPVILQLDNDGNSHLPLYDSGIALLLPHNEIKELDWSAEDACMDPKEWEELKKSGQRCLVIAP